MFLALIESHGVAQWMKKVASCEEAVSPEIPPDEKIEASLLSKVRRPMPHGRQGRILTKVMQDRSS